MKNFIAFLFLVIIYSCSTLKNVKAIKNISPDQQELLQGEALQKAYKTYSLQIPETWYSYRDVHGHIMHSPKVMRKRGHNFYENNFYVTEYSTKVCNAKSRKELLAFYTKRMKKFYPRINIVPQKFLHKKYGVYYLMKYTTSWHKKKLFTNVDVLYHYNNRNFILRYNSENKYYDEFIKDVASIINSFTIKETN
ncbi:MAG: hypothetical protein HWD85_04835 [Flavobacteriaceae bacterium]|nr:hypothetical protein [Flavobacteriaceae bacterium]